MMYDVLLKRIETFPYNDGKIQNNKLKNDINKSILINEFSTDLDEFIVDTLHPSAPRQF